MNQSTNFGLKTTGDNDQWRDTLDYHNENMGKIDSVLDANQDALGIVVDGNKSALGASSGQYIILRNSTISGKADGLYTAAKAIPANTAIDGTYLTAVPGGGLNALNSKIETTTYDILTLNSGCTGHIKIGRCAKIRVITGAIKFNSPGTSLIATPLSASDTPPTDIQFACSGYTVGSQCEGTISMYGDIRFNIPTGATNNSIKFAVTYFVS